MIFNTQLKGSRAKSFQLQSQESCNLLCKEHAECCDVNAKCVCNASTGTYSCVCQTGYYGNGLKGDCNGKHYLHFHILIILIF